MRKVYFSCIIGFFLSVILVSGTHAHIDCQAIQKVELTDVQKQELETLMKSIFNQKKEVVHKYVEFGVITEEKGEKMLKNLDRHYKKLEDNNFMPYCKDKKRKFHD